VNWQSLLRDDDTSAALPWVGGRTIYGSDGREWTIKGQLPRLHGWYWFNTSTGRKASLIREAESNEFESNWPTMRGYSVGDRFIPDNEKAQGSVQLFIIERGLRILSPVTVIIDPKSRAIMWNRDFPQPADEAMYNAYCDRVDSTKDIPDITPPLQDAYDWAVQIRAKMEKQAEERLQRIETEQKERDAVRRMGSAQGRRDLTHDDFVAAAKSALIAGGAEYLDARDAPSASQMIVNYSVNQQRLQCICDKHTLAIIDSGICLTDESTGKNYERQFSLESLPSVVREAMSKNRLVVWRHG